MRRFELCLLLGMNHPDEVRERLTMRQEADWYWFLRYHPQGARRDDWRIALLSYQIHKLVGSTVESVSDLMLSFVPPEPVDIHLKLQMAIDRIRAAQQAREHG